VRMFGPRRRRARSTGCATTRPVLAVAHRLPPPAWLAGRTRPTRRLGIGLPRANSRGAEGRTREGMAKAWRRQIVVCEVFVARTKDYSQLDARMRARPVLLPRAARLEIAPSVLAPHDVLSRRLTATDAGPARMPSTVGMGWWV
jgi:hypothetical protein